WGIIAPLSFIPHPGEYIAVGVFIAVGIAIFKLPDSTLIGREVVVENMTEGWIVLDTHNRVVDINPAAERHIGLNRDKIFGQPAEQILENWPRLVTEQQNQDHELQGSIKIGEEWRYLQMRVSPLTSNQEMLGKVILWRDITDRKKALEARRRAREEMFVLLRSISSAALRSMNLNEFLKEAIYQIVYSFHSRASVIFLRSNGAQAKKKAAYYLAAQHGLSPQEIDYLSSSPQLAEILKQAAENQEPLSLSNLGADGKMPALLQGSGLKSILIAPMIFEEKVLGMIGLARGEGAPYGVDEIARLTVVAEEIASLISSDRERQRVIATEERERVVRDLHDSIAQELCTLVILTEAEQASIEAGTVHDPAEVLSRIAEHARQALKEMRLFLFEMRPVDLERQGLAAVLHQRLAAVEGLADIQARLVTDDKIDLSPEKEEALYYIAQEALNNVLKHAKAKNVTIHLVRRRGQIVLEIQDDGCGFNLKKALAKGGMGLENMRERAAKVNGKLRIVSSPQKGTKVIVSVSRG
ncbi:MAG: ATP-binding protein, partial [candidate division WOR-3 bacterium]